MWALTQILYDENQPPSSRTQRDKCHWTERSKFKRVIIVTGTPSVGKTAVSMALAERLGAAHIDLAEVVKREKLSSGFDRRRKTVIADEDKLRKRMRELVRRGHNDIIIDGHYAASAVPKMQVTRAFVLRCHPRQLKQRMEQRGFKNAKLWENLAAEILDVCLYETLKNVGQDRVCEIDTTDKTVDAVVNEILMILEEKNACSVGIVDWIGTLEQEKSLDQFLKQL